MASVWNYRVRGSTVVYIVPHLALCFIFTRIVEPILSTVVYLHTQCSGIPTLSAVLLYVYCVGLQGRRWSETAVLPGGDRDGGRGHDRRLPHHQANRG